MSPAMMAMPTFHNVSSIGWPVKHADAKNAPTPRRNAMTWNRRMARA